MERRASPWKQWDRAPFPPQVYEEVEALHTGWGDRQSGKTNQPSDKQNTSWDIKAMAVLSPESKECTPCSLPISQTLACSTVRHSLHAYSVNKQEYMLMANNTGTGWSQWWLARGWTRLRRPDRGSFQAPSVTLRTWLLGVYTHHENKDATHTRRYSIALYRFISQAWEPDLTPTVLDNTLRGLEERVP